MATRTFGTGKFKYQVIDNWAKRPKCWPFTDAAGVGVDSKDRVYVFTRSQHPVMVFDKDGNFIRSWGEGIFARPHGVFIDKADNIWCTDDVDHTVRKFDIHGNLLLTIGTPGKLSDTGYDGKDFFSVKRVAPPFNRPTKAIIAPNGELIITDGYGNARVHRFTQDGKLIASWGEPGKGPGQFVLPHSVVADKKGNLYVADRENLRIQVFTSEGKYLTTWTDIGRPNDMCLDKNDILYVAEGNTRVSIWDLSGKLLSHWGSEEGRSNDAGLFMAPHAIARDSRGVLYVGEVCDTGAGYDRGSRAIQKFVPVS
jgi:DNA-binding beta-propeller fold protein YncE